MHTPLQPSRADGPGVPSARLLCLIALVPFLALALWEMRAPLSMSVGDQAQYLLHARSLLEGRGYTDNGYLHYPSVGISPAAYPPGLPALIAVVQGLGGSLHATRLVMVAGAALFLYLAGLHLSREDRWLGPAAVFVSGLVPQLALFASGLYTDLIFSAIVWGCFILIDRPGEWGATRVSALAVLGAAAIAFRTVGVVLIPALIAYQLWRTWRHGEPWKRAVVPLAVWIATFVAIDSLLPVASGYAHQIVNGAPGAESGGQRFAFVKGLVLRALEYRDFVSGLQLTPSPWRLANVGYHLLALLAAAVGAVVWARKAGVRFLFCFIAFYMGATLLMPWAIGRFLWPFLPLLWFVTLLGLRTMLAWVRVAPRHAMAATLAAALFVPVLAEAYGPAPEAVLGARDIREGRELYAMLARERARGPVRTLYFNPRDAALEPGIAAMGTPIMAPDSLLAEARSLRITHAIVGSMGMDHWADERLLAMIDAHPAAFEKAFANEQFVLYRFVPPIDSLERSGDQMAKPPR